jgi:hypothetical protein
MQPYRTTQLVFPGAKTIHDGSGVNGSGGGGYSNGSVGGYSNWSDAAHTVCEAIGKQVDC